jgi:hypothetical protein
MAAPAQQATDISTIAIAIIISIITALVTATLTYIVNKASYKRNTIHDNKILEIKNFYKAYQLFRVGVRDYHLYTQFGNKDMETTKAKSRELDSRKQDFEYESMVVKLFLDDTIYQKILAIENILFQIKRDIDLFHSGAYGQDFATRSASISIELDQTLPELMNHVELSLRKEFK